MAWYNDKSGVPDIYSVWSGQGWKEPIVIEQYEPDRTILTLPLVKKVAVKSGGKKVAGRISEKKQMQYNTVLTAMQPNKEYTAAYFCDVLDVKISRTKVILKELVDLGKIEVAGTYRDRRYMLKND